MSESLIIAMVQIAATVAMMVFTVFIFTRELKPFKRIGEVISGIDLKNTTKTTKAFNSLIQLGDAATNLNEAFMDDEVFEDYALKIAQKVKTVLHMSVLGFKAAGPKKIQKAERLVNEGIVKASKEISPMLDWALKITGIGEELEADPELFGPIMQIISEKGLLENLMGMAGNMDLGSLATPRDVGGAESGF